MAVKGAGRDNVAYSAQETEVPASLDADGEMRDAFEGVEG